MRKTLLDFFIVPNTTEEETNLSQRWMSNILVAALGIIFSFGGLNLFFEHNLSFWLLIILFFVGVIGIYLLARKNVFTASIFFCISAFLALAISTYYFGGVRSTSYIAMTVVIVLATMFLRARVAISIGSVSICYGFMLLVGETQGWYQPDQQYLEATDIWFGTAAIFTMLAVIMGIASHSIRTLVMRLRIEVAERRRAETALRDSAEYLSALHATTLAIINRLEIDPLLDSILYQAESLAGTTHGFIDLVQPGEQSTYEQVGHGVFKDCMGMVTPIGKGVTGQVWLTAKTVLVENYDAWPYHIESLENRGFACVMGVPLLSRNKVIGILGLGLMEPGTTFSPEKVKQVEQFAELASLALDNALLYKSAQDELLERTRAEDALRQSQEHLTLALESVNMGTWNWDIPADTITWSEQAFSILGVTPESFGGRLDHYKTLVYPPDRERMTKAIEKCLKGQGNTYEAQHRIQRDGIIRWLDARGRVYRDAQGHLLRMAGVVTDITESKRAEQALQRANATLEQKTAALVRRSSLLQLGSEVSRAASAILDPTLLSQEVVQFIKKRFGLYYVGLFLVDDLGSWANLVAGTGRAGQKLLSRKHKLEVGDTSMVGWCIRHRQARIALDVGTEAVRFNNPLLPDTRSELALPLISRGDILGALTIQSVQEAAFSDEDIATLQTMADQLANAIINARLYEQLQQELEERKRAEQEILKLNAELEDRVRRRTLALQASEEKFRALAENNPLQITRYAHNGRYLYVNHLRGNSFLQPQDIIGKTVREVLGDIPIVDFAEACIQQVFDTQQPLRTEYELFNSVAVWWLAPEFDPTGKVTSVIATTLDITERKRMEQVLRQRSMELQAANRELEAFSYSVSHDLRAPLRAIDGFSRILQDDFHKDLPEDAQKHLQRISDAAIQMGRLIDDMLRLSRVTRAELHRDLVDFSSLAMEVGRELASRDADRQVALYVQPGLTAYADERLLRLALENLMNNAWKFSQKNHQAHIEVGQAENTSRNIAAYFVRDNGVGFNMAYADKLFGAFQRLHRADEFPGTGIGLAIVQRVIHRHGGQIWAESEPGKGAVFYFTLEE
jgi:PAS domain S-box-containing protein